MLAAFFCTVGFVGLQPAHAASPWKPHPNAINHPRGKVPHATSNHIGFATSANPNCPSCSPPLNFALDTPVAGGISGTPGHVTVTPVYWAPSGYGFNSSYKAVINGYLQNVAQASRQSSNVFSVAAQYYQQSSGGVRRRIDYVVQAGAELDDTSPFPSQGGSSGCTAASGYTACVTDVGEQNELRQRVTSAGLPFDDSHIYMVMFPPQVETCQGPGSAAGGAVCSSNDYCAYHSSISVGSGYLLYGNEPYPLLRGCTDPFNGPQSPNGDTYADAQVSLLSHELNETITDWAGAWFDAAGYENGDECAYVYGSMLGATGVATDGLARGTGYNQVVGGGRYYTQEEFSNTDFALGVGDPTTAGGTVVPGCQASEDAPQAVYTPPASLSAGVAATFDGSASTDRDGSATALSYSWNWGDGASSSAGATAAHAFAGGTYNVTLTVTDPDGWSNSTSHSVSVVAPVATGPCTAATLSGSAASPQAVGVAITFTASAAGCSKAEFRFWLLPRGGSWTLERDYGASTWTWNTTGLPSGVYEVGVWARQAGSSSSYEAFGITTFTLGAGTCSAASLSPSAAPPQEPGGSIQLTAASSGCAGAIYEFWLLRPGGAWAVAQPYSSASTWTWNTAGAALGTYQVGVWVRQSTSPASYDGYFIGTFQIAMSTCTSASLTASPASPQAAGTSVVLTATSAGCPDPRYQFWVQPPGGGWQIVQSYGAATSFTWASAGKPAGVYHLGVWARENGSPNSYDSYWIVNFQLT